MPPTQTLNLAGAGILAFIAYRIMMNKKEKEQIAQGEIEYAQWQIDNPGFTHPEDVDSDTNRIFDTPGRPFQTKGSSQF